VMTRFLGKELHKKRWVGFFLFIGGLALVGAGFWYAGEADAFLAQAQYTEGTIVEMKRERSTKGLRQDHPIVRFIEPETGKERTFKSKLGPWPSPFEQGERVEVAYDPGESEKAAINSFWTVWLPPSATILFGLACLVAGSATLRNTRKS